MFNDRAYVLECLRDIDEAYGPEIFDRSIAPVETGIGCPYSFPARTIGDVVDFLLIGRAYNATGRRDGSPLSWNVKAYSYDVNGDDTEAKRDPALDGAWESYLNTGAGSSVYEWVYEAAQEYYRNDWSAYPGDDQGDWEFAFYGRSGGHLCLLNWRGHDFARMDVSNYAEFVAALVDDAANGKPGDLLAFYKGIVTADHDFTPSNASKNVTFHWGCERAKWEERRADIAKEAAHAAYFAVNKTCTQFGVELTDDLLSKTLDHVKEFGT